MARTRGVNPEPAQRVADEHTTGYALGCMGEPAVNVLGVNLALDQLGG